MSTPLTPSHNMSLPDDDWKLLGKFCCLPHVDIVFLYIWLSELSESGALYMYVRGRRAATQPVRSDSSCPVPSVILDYFGLGRKTSIIQRLRSSVPVTRSDDAALISDHGGLRSIGVAMISVLVTCAQPLRSPGIMVSGQNAMAQKFETKQGSL